MMMMMMNWWWWSLLTNFEERDFFGWILEMFLQFYSRQLAIPIPDTIHEWLSIYGKCRDIYIYTSPMVAMGVIHFFLDHMYHRRALELLGCGTVAIVAISLVKELFSQTSWWLQTCSITSSKYLPDAEMHQTHHPNTSNPPPKEKSKTIMHLATGSNSLNVFRITFPTP